MEDSIERIREDAEKHYADYWGCEGRRCDECRANGVHEDCVTAKYIDLFNRAMRFIDERQLPEGVEWPRFEDGELVQLGDMFTLNDGSVEEVRGISFGKCALAFAVEEGEEWHSYGYRVKRAEPADTQEKIDADAGKDVCEYFGWCDKPCDDDGGCPACIGGDCRAIMIRDLLRRQRELCERGGE